MTPNLERPEEFAILDCRDCGARGYPFWWLIDREALTVTCTRCLGTHVRHNGHPVNGHPWLADVPLPLRGIQLEASLAAAKARRGDQATGRVRHGG